MIYFFLHGYRNEYHRILKKKKKVFFTVLQFTGKCAIVGSAAFEKKVLIEEF